MRVSRILRERTKAKNAEMSKSLTENWALTYKLRKNVVNLWDRVVDHQQYVDIVRHELENNQ